VRVFLSDVFDGVFDMTAFRSFSLDLIGCAGSYPSISIAAAGRFFARQDTGDEVFRTQPDPLVDVLLEGGLTAPPPARVSR